jgi:MYXO-CTERM domain-containing protein
LRSTASVTGTTATFDFIRSTPEPDSCLIAGAALVGLGLLGRKRRFSR